MQIPPVSCYLVPCSPMPSVYVLPSKMIDQVASKCVEILLAIIPVRVLYMVIKHVIGQ